MEVIKPVPAAMPTSLWKRAPQMPPPFDLVLGYLISQLQSGDTLQGSASTMATPSGSVLSTSVFEPAFQTLVTTTTAVVTIPPPSSTSTTSRSAETSSTVPTTSRDTTTASSTPISSSFTSSSMTSTWPTFVLDSTSSSSTSIIASTSSIAIPTSFSFAPVTTTSSSHSHDPTADPGPIPTVHEPSGNGMAGLSPANKKAIVGSLAGAIGFMVLLGILLCVCLRKRHRRDEAEADEANDDGLKKPAQNTKPSVVRQWSEFALGHLKQRSTPELVQPKTPSAVDGSLIRVSTDHWSRPYAKSSGPRESIGPAPLRIVNPDDGSRSATPEPQSNGSFLRKQRSAIAAILQERPRMASRSSSREQIGKISYPKPIQTMHIQSGRAVINPAPRPSLGSQQSENSLPIVTQKPPEDPFMGSNMETAQEIAPPSPPRGKPVPQRAYPKPPPVPASAPQPLVRGISQVGKSSNPWRGKVIPSVALPPRIRSYESDEFGKFDFSDDNRESVTSAYTRRQTQGTTRTARSEQFDLMISPTLPDNNKLEKAIEEEEQRQQQKKRQETPAEDSSPNWKPYEGT